MSKENPSVNVGNQDPLISDDTNNELGVQNEVTLSHNELCNRLKTLRSTIMADKERTAMLKDDKQCRVWINQQNRSLEFRIGLKQAVGTNDIQQLTELIQVYFNFNGEVASAVLGNLERIKEGHHTLTHYTITGMLSPKIQYPGNPYSISHMSQSASGPDHAPDDGDQELLKQICSPIIAVILELTQATDERVEESKDQTAFPTENTTASQEENNPELGRGE